MPAASCPAPAAAINVGDDVGVGGRRRHVDVARRLHRALGGGRGGGRGEQEQGGAHPQHGRWLRLRGHARSSTAALGGCQAALRHACARRGGD